MSNDPKKQNNSDWKEVVVEPSQSLWLTSLQVRCDLLVQLSRFFLLAWIFTILYPRRCKSRNGHEPHGLGNTGNQQALENRTWGKNLNVWIGESEKERLEIAVVTAFPMDYGILQRSCNDISVIKFKCFLENKGDSHSLINKGMKMSEVGGTPQKTTSDARAITHHLPPADWYLFGLMSISYFRNSPCPTAMEFYWWTIYHNVWDIPLVS